MMPVLSHELLMTAVEMVCYFCTAVGVLLTFMFAPRACKSCVAEPAELI